MSRNRHYFHAIVCAAFLIELVSSKSAVPSAITTYDQKQTGKYNIHFNIKDVQIIAVDGESFDGGFGDDTIYDYGDYDYDPAHLTINPIFGLFGSGTSKPTSTPVTITTTKKPKTTTTTTTSAPKTDAPTTKSPDVEVHNNKTQNDTPATLKPSPIYVLKPSYPQHNPANIDYEEIPVEVIVEPILKPKYRHQRPVTFRRNKYGKKNSVEILKGQDEEVSPATTNCHRGEYRDKQGKCRVRRSGGIMKLFNILSVLKEKDDN